MPKCLINSVRDYKFGKYHGHLVYDPFVMTTRSGLSINTIPRGSSYSGVRRLPSPPASTQDTSQTKRREVSGKSKSLSYLSFVTRFKLSRRIPELDAKCRPSSKVYADWKEELLRFDGQRCTESDDTESENEDRICEGTIDESQAFLSQDSNDLGDDVHNQWDGVSDGSSSPEIDVVGNGSTTNLKDIINEQSVKQSSLQPSQLKTSINLGFTDTNNYLQTSKLICTTLGQKINLSIVSGYPRLSTGLQGPFTGNVSGAENRVMTLSEASSLFFIKPNFPTGQELQKELECLDEREKYCKNTAQKCPHCDKEFFLYSALQSHIRRHGKQENKCEICGKIFSRSWLLKGHLRTHTGERPFNCPEEECDKAFADKSNLRSHMLIHSTKNKAHVCSRCGRGFAQKRYLHKHMLEVCRVLAA